MTNDYIQLANIDEALRYVSSVFKQGNTLGLLAAETLKVIGDVYAFMPLPSRDIALPALTQGGLCASCDSYGALASEIERYLSAGASKIVIFEDASARAGDKWLEGPVASALRVAVY